MKNIFQLPDTFATLRRIVNFTKYDSVHTEKWKPNTDPRYNTFPSSFMARPMAARSTFCPVFPDLHHGVLLEKNNFLSWPVAYTGILFGGGSTNSVEDRGQRERGSGGGGPLVRGSGGSCNLVQEISFHIVKFS